MKKSDRKNFTRRSLEFLKSACADKKITHAEYRTLNTLVLVFLNAKDNIAWPSLKTLGAAMGVTADAVKPHAKSLEAKGLITRQRRFARSTIYAVNFRAYPSDDGHPTDGMKVIPDGQMFIRNGMKVSPLKDEGIATEHLNEHPKEHPTEHVPFGRVQEVIFPKATSKPRTREVDLAERNAEREEDEAYLEYLIQQHERSMR